MAACCRSQTTFHRSRFKNLDPFTFLCAEIIRRCHVKSCLPFEFYSSYSGHAFVTGTSAHLGAYQARTMTKLHSFAYCFAQRIFQTYLVVFEQDPRYHTQPIFGCLSSSCKARMHSPTHSEMRVPFKSITAGLAQVYEHGGRRTFWVA